MTRWPEPHFTIAYFTGLALWCGAIGAGVLFLV
jgi:hypothetical protein